EVDAIPLSSGFDLAFYRQLVRNGFDAPAHLEALRRWKIDPRIYLRTVDDAGTAIDEKTLDSTEATIRETIPLWTAGTLKPPSSSAAPRSAWAGMRGLRCAGRASPAPRASADRRTSGARAARSGCITSRT